MRFRISLAIANKYLSTGRNIFGGFKVAITLAVVGTIVGEFVASNSGIGYLLLVATGSMNTALLFAGIVILTVIGVILFYSVEILERIVSPWHVRTRGDEMITRSA